MKVYLAGRVEDRGVLRGWRAQLQEAGHVSTTNWLDEAIEQTYDELSHAQRREIAVRDLEDIVDATAVVMFNPVEHARSGRGGRHVEVGAALAWGKIVIVVGPVSNVFHAHPQVQIAQDIEQVIQLLAAHEAVWAAAAPWNADR